MCILFGKKARLLKEENANLKARIEAQSKRAETAENRLKAVNAEHEKETQQQIGENTRLRNIIAGRDNTINQLKAELARLKPNRAKNGRFTFKPKNDEVR
ncbi:MAG: hypothetical protein II307_05725 [Alistipes sp.]|nr:hypothetical protein [Alistipes sp.]